MTAPILAYFWICVSAATLAAIISGSSVVVVALPLALIGLGASIVAVRQPGTLFARLTLAVAVNSTWMFGLYTAAHIHNGTYMLDVHMFYFINTGILLAFACWRTVLVSTLVVAGHHFCLSLIQPMYVWQDGIYPWIHFANHALLVTMNCIGAGLIALSLEKVLLRSEAMAGDMRHRSRHDELTGLLNRRGLRDGMRELYTAPDTSQELTVVAIDLDGFKQINDTAGHSVGDKLLCRVAVALSDMAPDGAIVARIGGDEYLVIAAHVSLQSRDAFFETFLTWARRPCQIEGREVRFGTSLGAAVDTVKLTEVDRLLVDADLALYAAKAAGKNRVSMFGRDMRDAVHKQKNLMDDVLRGLEEQEFEPYFQPQHDASTGEIVGIEALARWHHPVMGTVPPKVFLEPLAASGRMAELDLQILEMAATEVRRLRSRGLSVPELAVNIGLSQLHDAAILRAVDNLDPLPCRLTFEILESALFDDSNLTERMTLDRMRENGLGIAIDDFGTGHGSIHALTSVRPDKLKIDKQMIRPVSQSEDHRVVLESVLGMARKLGIETVAEGVETYEDVRLLAEMGVDTLQGYYFASPMSARQLEHYLTVHRQAPQKCSA